MGEQKAGQGPWLCGHQSCAYLRFLWEAELVTWPDFYRSQSQPPIRPHSSPTQSTTHTHIVHTYGSMLHGAKSTC